jgi:hypothetical protein
MKRRITLVNSVDRRHDWNVARDARSRIVFAASFVVLRYALEDAIREFEQDIERVIVDRTATPADFLDVLAQLAEDFAGDVVYVRDDEAAYISAIGRGGNRVLYALNANDLRFYLETHGLIATESVAAA